MAELRASTSIIQTQANPFKTALPLIALVAIVTLAGALRYANLEALGDGNIYYTAAVKAMLQSPANFFFVAAEPGGGVSIDKPPFGLWVQASSAAILGVNGLAVTLPSILAGMASVAVLYHLVSQRFGALAGLIAAFVLATTPVSIAVDGTNNLDSVLIFVLLLAAWAFIRAVETRRLAPLLIGAALVGIGFNTKMLQAYLILPAVYAAYFLSARLTWTRKLAYLIGASVVLLVVSLSWALIVDLTPADQRPYVGGSQTNSVLELALGYNGLQRVTGAGSRAGGTPGGQRDGGPPPGMAPGGPGGFNPTGSEVGEPGPLRLFSAPLANELSWALPLALFMLAVLILSERPRWPLGVQHQSAVLWGGWLLTGMAFFTVSAFFHAYYLATIAPPLAALIGIGAAAIAQSPRARLFTVALIGAVLGTLIYQWLTADHYNAALPELRLIAVTALAVGIVSLTISYWFPRWRRISVPALVSAALIIPVAWGGLTAQDASTNAVLPSSYAGTAQEGMFGGRGALVGNLSLITESLLAYVEANQTSDYLLVVGSAMQGAPLVLETGQPVLYLGGFNGSDAIYTEADLAQMVADGEVRFFLTGISPFDRWVVDTCRLVEDVSINVTMPGGGMRPPAGGFPGGFAPPALYDCQMTG